MLSWTSHRERKRTERKGTFSSCEPAPALLRHWRRLSIWRRSLPLGIILTFREQSKATLWTWSQKAWAWQHSFSPATLATELLSGSPSYEWELLSLEDTLAIKQRKLQTQLGHTAGAQEIHIYSFAHWSKLGRAGASMRGQLVPDTGLRGSQGRESTHSDLTKP